MSVMMTQNDMKLLLELSYFILNVGDRTKPEMQRTDLAMAVQNWTIRHFNLSQDVYPHLSLYSVPAGVGFPLQLLGNGGYYECAVFQCHSFLIQ